MEQNVADLRYFKLWILLDQIIWVWNIKCSQHRVLKILRFKCFILFQRLNSFSKRYTFATWIWWCEPFIFDLTEFMFDTSQFYEIGLQRYMNKKIRVCGKDSIPFLVKHVKGLRKKFPKIKRLKSFRHVFIINFIFVKTQLIAMIN